MQNKKNIITSSVAAKANTIYFDILNNRLALMGIAMFFVIVYHAFCWIYNPLGFFNIGYVGVDIFLFLSGLGLSLSLKKNNIFQFYKNRFMRIYPLYFISVLVTYLLFNTNWRIDDLIWNLLSIGFYTKHGANRFDWYLESLFTLYLFAPMFYFLGKSRHIGLFFLLAITAFVLYHHHVSWWYDCFIGRLPVFFYGMAFHRCFKSYKTISIIGILLYLPCRIYISNFLASSFLAIPIIASSLWVMKKLKGTFILPFSFIGKHTLEIYLANLYIYWSLHTYCFSTIERLLIYILVQTIATIALIYVNNYLKQRKLQKANL